MAGDQTFRVLLIALFVAGFGTSAYFRYRARKQGGVIPRRREGGWFLALRLLVGLPLYLALLAYMIHPPWMAWSALDLPAALRWLGVGLAAAAVLLLVRVLRAIGKNVSETTLTKEGHELVTHGPYRRVRHPLYAVASLLFLALALVAANGFIAFWMVLVVALVRLLVVPREEAALVARFGDRYRRYQATTGALLPRLGRPTSRYD